MNLMSTHKTLKMQMSKADTEKEITDTRGFTFEHGPSSLRVGRRPRPEPLVRVLGLDQVQPVPRSRLLHAQVRYQFQLRGFKLVRIFLDNNSSSSYYLLVK